MPTVLLKLLTSATGILGAGSAILVLLLTVQTARLHHAKGDLEAARRASIDSATGRTWRVEALAELKTSGALAASLDDQTHALGLLKTAQKRANDAAAKALSAAEVAGDRDRAIAKRILALSAGGDQCASANAAIIESLGDKMP
ncbi:MAG: hypothetical protein JSR86_07780 [Proteobacteria bacterium]|nr:hypothetical protein [Pseudomonadota bacterium]